MKLLFTLLVSASASNEFLAELSGHPDGNGAMQTLTHLMTAAQKSLSLVERRYGKVVKKVRKQSESFFQEEAKTYADALGSYSSEMVEAEGQLQSAVSVARAGVKENEAAASKTNAWNDPQVMERAKLNSQVAATDRAIKKVERQRQSELREAREHSEESIESEGQKLGMKLGDMTPIVDKAKQTIEARADTTPAVAAAVKVSAPPASKKASLASLQDGLAKAVAKEKTVAADAKKKLDGFLSKADQEISSKRAKMDEGLSSAQKQELKILEPKTTQAKAKPATKKAKVKAAAAVKPVKAKGVAALKAVPAVKPVAVKVKAAPVVKPVKAKGVAALKAAPAVKPAKAKAVAATTPVKAAPAVKPVKAKAVAATTPAKAQK